MKLNFIKGQLFHCVGSDGIFVVSPGELLHPGYDGFEQDQAEISPNKRVDGLERAIAHCEQIVGNLKRKEKISVSLNE